jgi:hypothetical protein
MRIKINVLLQTRLFLQTTDIVAFIVSWVPFWDLALDEKILF